MTPTQPNTPINVTPEAAVVRDLAQQALAAKPHPHPDGLPFVVVPAGHEVKTLALEACPPRPKGTVKLRDATSFIDYVNRHKGVDAMIYATLDPARFLAVLNDHFPISVTPAEGCLVGWKDWRADFTVPASREWDLWHKANRKDMSQLSFAEFIEDNLPDIIDPSGDALMRLVLNFEATKSSAFKGAHRLQDGSTQVQWLDEVSGNGSATIPAAIRLRIPVFENDVLYEVEARFKYRISGDGKLALRYELVRPHKVLEAAFKRVWDDIVSGTQLKPLLGAPE